MRQTRPSLSETARWHAATPAADVLSPAVSLAPLAGKPRIAPCSMWPLWKLSVDLPEDPARSWQRVGLPCLAGTLTAVMPAHIVYLDSPVGLYGR